jgi:subtilisin family serine protease
VPTAAPTAAPFSRFVPVSGFSNTIGYGLADATAAGSRVLGRQLTDGTRFAGFPQGQLKCEGLWATGARGSGVLVAVIDSGLQTAHPDLSSNVWVNATERNGVAGRDDDGNGFVDDVNGWNAILQSGVVQDDNGHGTHVSGTIAALDNGVGVLGVAPQAKIMSVKVVGSDGSGSLSSFIAGLDYAVRNGAKVINMSLGGGQGSPIEDEALSAAARAGAVLVMAAGNDGLASPDAPALYASRFGLAVGAVDSTGAQASFSNRSGFTSMGYVTAPGVQIVSTYLNGQYARMSGTSMASPHVAGLAALLWSARPSLTAAEVEAAIYQTATRR